MAETPENQIVIRHTLPDKDGLRAAAPPGADTSVEPAIIRGVRKHMVLYPAAPTVDGNEQGGWSTLLLKGLGVESGDTSSKQGANEGEVSFPFDFASAKAFKNCDPYHSSCIEAKIAATVGLGFETNKTRKLLDPLCSPTFQSVATAENEDYWETGNGYMEIVRKESNQKADITGIHHIEAELPRVVIEDPVTQHSHWRVFGSDSGKEVLYAKFGDLDRFMKTELSQTAMQKQGGVAELIHIPRPSALSRHYGMPDWLSAVASIELVHAIKQYNYDFFINSGVPEFIFVVIGKQVNKDDWKKIKDSLEEHVGIGNSHQTLALNLPWSKQDTETQFHKLSESQGEGWFQDFLDTLSLAIVTAHRVPPLLGNIVIPGKLGANNEFINVMWVFQTLVIRPAQVLHRDILTQTLGGKFGVKGLTEADFEPKTIVDEIPFARMEAPGSINEPAKEPGTRADISAMLEKAGQNPGRVIGELIAGMLHGPRS